MQIVGCDCKMTIGSTEVTTAKGVTVNVTAKEIDTTVRGVAGTLKWDSSMPGTFGWDISADIVRDSQDPAYNALLHAFLNREAVTVTLTEPAAILSETPTPGTQDVWSGSAYVTKCTRSEPIDNVVSIALTLKGTGALSIVAAA